MAYSLKKFEYPVCVRIDKPLVVNRLVVYRLTTFRIFGQYLFFYAKYEILKIFLSYDK